MKERIKKIISNKAVLIIIYILFAVAASIQSLNSGKKALGDSGKKYTTYNNYIIFKQSFYHLKNNQDLYIAYPDEHWDLYKYTPAFSVFFGLFTFFPDSIGLNLWNLLNALILLLAIYYLPRLSKLQKGYVSLIVLIELMTSMQNQQSNALIAGLLVLSFGLLEKEKYFLAALCIIFSAYIKLFGLVGLALFIFYPKKWKLALYSAISAAIFLAIPLLYIDITQYKDLLSSYGNMLSGDEAVSYGFSVMGWLHTWFGIDPDKKFVVLAGIIIFLIPLMKFNLYKSYLFRYLLLVSVLIWIVVFNHKAESPTFIIAMTGVALWFIQCKKNSINIFLFICAFILASLSPTDIFPKFLRDEYVIAYSLKVVPCILIWVKVIYDMLLMKPEKAPAIV